MSHFLCNLVILACWHVGMLTYWHVGMFVYYCLWVVCTEQWWWYDNQLTGTIPVGNWTSLRLWHLDGNDFSSVSPDICKLRSSNGGLLVELVTECNDDGPMVRCDCCDSCVM
jgi:hypothetical protein